MKNKAIGWIIAILALWLVVKIGLLDAVIGSILVDLTAEAARMTGLLSVLLTALAVPIGMAALFLLFHRKWRALGIELLVVGGIVVLAAHMLPVAGTWLNVQSQVLSASVSHAPTINVQATGR